MSFYQIIILCSVGGMLAAGDFFMKSWAENHPYFQQNFVWYAFAITMYVVGMSIYGYTLRSADFASASYSILLFNMIFVAIAGYAYFGDTLSVLEIAAIVLGISSVALFALSPK
ncbi:MAG: hypothetical protein WAV46_01555 [Candidatus Moraniibacteriota bacterium]